MVFRKITVDNSVRYLPKSEQRKERKSNAKTIKTGSLPCKQNKVLSQNNTEFLKNAATNGFGIPECITNCYF